jgi:hypothetical protein
MSTIPRQCAATSERFEISDRDCDFYAQMEVSLPQLCPSERMRRRLAWRNERQLYRRTCDKTGRLIISVYSPKTSFQVYAPDTWWSDAWDPLEYGAEYSFDRSFLEQFADLLRRVPRLAISNRGENSDYCNFSVDVKDCYLCVSGGGSEKCLYSYFTSFSNECVDCSNVLSGQYSYDCVDCSKIYECFFCQDCESSSALLFCKNCIGCEHCIGCVGLHKARYHIFNQPCSKSDYEAFRSRLFPLTPEAISRCKREVDGLTATALFKYYHGHSNENVLGDYVTGSKNVFMSFDINGAEDIAYCHNSPRKMRSAYDSCYSFDSELLFECLSGVRGYRQVCSAYCWDSSDAYYSEHCFSCRNILGCVGLRNKQFCILNQQLSESEYRELFPKIVARIKQENIWGEFFPAELAPFPYNDTAAHDYFPLTREDALARKLTWSEAVEIQTTEASEPTKEARTSSLSGKPFRIIRAEAEFYARYGLPLPALTPAERMYARLQKRNPRRFWDRTCVITNEPVRTTYSPDRPERIACEKAYQQHMFA